MPKKEGKRRRRGVEIVAILCAVALSCVCVSIYSVQHLVPTALLKVASVDGCAQSEQEYSARVKAGEVDHDELKVRHYFEVADTDHTGEIFEGPER
jgi:FlaG/FlaF family flagellin (archaellin)